MAATDKHYRDQNTLDIVFAVSSIAMLVSLVWMFLQDYNREFKHEQRLFRDVEAALFERLAVDQLPDAEEYRKAEEAVTVARNRRDEKKVEEEIKSLKDKLATTKSKLAEAQAVAQDKKAAPAKQKAAAKDAQAAAQQIKTIESEINYLHEWKKLLPEVSRLKKEIAEYLPKKERSELEYNDVKSRLESRVSFYNIEVEHNGPNSETAKQYFKDIQALEAELQKAQDKKDDILAKLRERQEMLGQYEAPLTEALTNWKKVTDRFDTQVRLAINKKWTAGDAVRAFPVLDAFASPIKIHQFTINDVPIDYNFKYVTRFDRCMTCHQGIDKPAFTRERLTELTRVSAAYQYKLESAWQIMYERRQKLAGLPEKNTYPKWEELKLSTVPKSELTSARVTEFCAHPRLELFVGPNSKHPAEKFGCTSCHSGQGSATSFTLASHTPNSSRAKDEWEHEHAWESNHMWDFPMLPMRFIESSCLKCHHQVTDLYSANGRNEAPKLLRGYNLIKENGCFGCHEIAGKKAGKDIGPDLRLEPTPPLDDLTPSERVKIESDAENPPGQQRKVGPSLYRLAEKTNADWAAKWLRSPRGFRPDTKMPHFYGLSNNDPSVLPEEQKPFPDAEMAAITHYLFKASKAYVKSLESLQPPAKNDKDYDKKWAEYQAAAAKDQARFEALLAQGKLSPAEKTELEEVRQRIRLRQTPALSDLAPDHKGDPKQGRILFSERGCLACHSHQGTATPQGKSKDPDWGPAIVSEANFGPNLSQLAAKLGKTAGDKASARVWLIQWLLDPHVHSPRSRMPVTHLTPNQAADIAAWLLSQPATDLGAEWAKLEVKEPDAKTLKKLAEVYLSRILSRTDMVNFLEKAQIPADVVKDLGVEEREFARLYKKPNDTESLKHYLGKKAIGRLGCYACHDIPGFDNAKPIGVGLNDWGKKAPERLAFEDIASYLRKHYHVVPSMVDEDGKPAAIKDGKKPYEQFFADALLHHQREGFLYQKILDPRSYDHNRLRPWDDLSRMPQFRFARLKKKEGETDAQFEARQWKEEAEAREAVMTFILGLVAEQVPAVSINQPKGDRLAEVKGRQVLDKYNCAGCHLIRPGVFDFKSTPDVIGKLEQFAAQAKKNAEKAGDHVFLHHANWVGLPPASLDKLMAHAVRAEIKAEEADPNQKNLRLRLTRALRFLGLDKSMKDIPAAATVEVPLGAMTYPSAKTLANQEALDKFLAEQGPYGGAFADLLVDYLVDKDKGKADKFFVREDPDDPRSDSSKARPAVPPILLGQGERTQTEWLFTFLLDPQPVRKMTVLRMPKFNMSKEEARALVDYFAAVERVENPGVGLQYPYETIVQQQEGAQDAYLLEKNAQYVARLKKLGMLDARVKELTPVWQQILKDYEARHKEAKARLEQAKPILEAAQKAEAAEQDKDKKKVLEQRKKDAERLYEGWKQEEERLAKAVKSHSLEEQRKTWETQEAYTTDAFKLLANKQLCLQCHQVGPILNNNQIQGPPLNLAHARLRPGWLERWIATPQKFLTYASSMPNNFPADKVGQFSEWFAGTPLEQVSAVRDLLMIYPRAQAMPLNQHWILPQPEPGSATKEDKTGDKK